jgi:hypothetical protein
MDLNDVDFDAFLANDRTLTNSEVVPGAESGHSWTRLPVDTLSARWVQ